MAKAPTEAEIKAKLYAVRRTDYGYHGKFTERAVTGGYTIPARDVELVRNHDVVTRQPGGHYTTPTLVNRNIKPPRGSARPHGGYNRDCGSVERATIKQVDANLGKHFKAIRRAKAEARAKRRAAMGLVSR